MVKDWNRNEVIPMKEVFHFKNSLRPFISVEDIQGTQLFIDINEGLAYPFESLEYEGLDFYEDEVEEDEDFKGVEIAGTIKDWF